MLDSCVEGQVSHGADGFTRTEPFTVGEHAWPGQLPARGV